MEEPTFTPATAPDFDPVPVRERHDGWTRERQAEFIAALGETACVTDACMRVGMSMESAYRLRRRFDARSFRLAWDAALDYGIRRLSDAVLSRAIYGVPVPHYYKGELVGEHRRYNDRLAMFLMRYRDPLHCGRHLDKVSSEGHDDLFAQRLQRGIGSVESDVAEDALNARWQPAREQGQENESDLPVEAPLPVVTWPDFHQLPAQRPASCPGVFE